MDIIKSQKGKQQVLYEGYRYRCDKLNQDGSSSWRCIKKECAGRLKMRTDGTLQTSTDHMHAPDTAKNESEKIKAAIRERAENSVEKPHQIIVNSTAGVLLEAAHLLPLYSASQRTVERKQKRPDVTNPRPQSIQDIILPDTIKASSKILQPPTTVFSKKTQQQFHLLKKRAKRDIISADLIAKRQEVKMRMEEVAECREKLQQKNENNRTQGYGFQNYLQECDLKKKRALAKYKLEQKNNALKRQEIHTLKRELQKLKIRQQELQKKIDKYKSYEHFLKKIINLLPPDFWGYQEDSVIKTLTQRHKTLVSTNQNLKNHLLNQEENIEIMHHKCAATKEKNNTMRFVLASKVSELQSKYNALKERNLDLINYIDNKEAVTSQRTRELSRMLVGISNMAERCYMKHYGPLGEMTFQSKLDMIQEFICEKTELLKPEGYRRSY